MDRTDGEHIEAEGTDSDTDETASKAACTDSEAELTRDDIFHVLQCRRRRLVLKYLQEYDGEGPARMSDIAEHIAAEEHDTTVHALQSQERQRVYIALYQSHLSKMDKVGVLDYNQSRGYVEATPLADRLTPYLDCEPSLLNGDSESDGQETTDTLTDATVDKRWQKRYLYAAGGSLLVVSALSSGLLSLPVPTQFSLGVLVSVLFALLAASHWLTASSGGLTERFRTKD